MNLALVVTLGGDLVRSSEHLGIGYLAATLRKNNYNVTVLEYNAEDLENEEKYLSLLAGYSLIGFTTTCVTLKYIINFINKIKQRYPDTYILLGGHMATFGAKEIMEKYDDIDFIILGEGELTILDLINALEKGKNLSDVKGIAYRKDNHIVFTEARALISNLDMLPFPSRDQFEQNNRKYQYLRISTSRGCLGNCAFCSSFVGRMQKGSCWRGRSPSNVVDEIEGLVNKYDFHTYDFIDSSFEDPGSVGKQRIKDIAKELINRKLNIYYNCCFRAENWSDKDDSLLSYLVASGLEKVNIGFESGNDRGLKILNKRATMSDNWRVIAVMKKHPMIYVTFGFIMLHPYSTLQDIIDNANFLHKTGIGQVIRHYFWMLEVYPGTQMEKRLKVDNLLCNEYDIDDGMYNYHFAEPEMSVFPPIFKEILSIKSVWDFEIFDIVLHTFISRLIRRYGKTEIHDTILDFQAYVEAERRIISDFNYDFFMEIIESRNCCDIPNMKENLDKFLTEKMTQIKNKQYQFGVELIRKGYELSLK